MPDEHLVFEAIKVNDANRLRSLLAKSPALAAARDEKGVSAILVAVYHRRQDMVDALLSAAPELDVFEASALGQLDVVERWLTSDPGWVFRFSPDGFTPLHLAAFFDRPAVVERLLAVGAPVNVFADNPMRVAPLHSAAAARSVEAVRLLLEAGADPNAEQEGGFTALHAAALHGDGAMARLLVEHGADPDARTADGRTPRAMAEGKPEVEDLLRG